MVWLKRTAWFVAALVLFGIVAWLAVPPLLKWQGQSRLSELLGRQVTIGAVSFHPWNLELVLSDMKIAAAPSSGASAPPQLELGRLRANFSAASLWRLAPVIEGLDVDALRLRVARLAEGRYDVDDLLARYTPDAAAPADQDEPAHFALYNVRVRDAELRLDDRPAQRVHVVDALQLTLPFLSNLDAYVEVEVEPRLAFRLNGTAFDTGAEARPFADTRDGDLKLAMADLDLMPYVPYLPRSLPVRLARGKLSTDVSLHFSLPRAGAPVVALRGTAGLRDFALTDASGAPLLALRDLRLGLRDVQPLARQLAFDTLRIDGAQVDLARDAAGRLKLPALAAGPAPPASAARAAAAPAAPWRVSFAAVELQDGSLAWRDAGTQPAAALALDGVRVALKQLQWPMTQAVPVSLDASVRGGPPGAATAGRLHVEGSVGDAAAQLDVTLDALALDAFAPYVARALVPRVEGTLSARGRLDWAGGDAPRLRLALSEATLAGLRVRDGNARGAAADAATLARLRLADVQLDAVARTVVLGRVALDQPSLQVTRDAQGRLDLQGWLRERGPASAAPPAAPHDKRPEPPWQVTVREFALDGGAVRFADARVRGAAARAPLRVQVQQLKVGAQNLVWRADRPGTAAKVQLSARVSGPPIRGTPQAPGTVDWRGDVGIAPLQASGQLRVARFPAHLFAAYAGDALPVRLLRAQAGYTGRLALRELPAGLDLTAQGDVLLGDVHADARTGDTPAPGTLASRPDQLFGWEALALKGLSVTLKPGARPRVEVAEATLEELYTRLVVTEQGRFNLQDVRAGAAAAPAAGASAPVAVAATPPAASAVAAQPVAPSEELPFDLRIGATRLVNAKIDFTDRFVRPNYSAALTELNGSVGPFSSDSRDMAAVELRGRAAGTALLEIAGRINPTVRPPAMDIKAKATDLELAPLSAYAGKYAGYAIERGKLSLNVAYRIDADGRLEASNQLVLNQLTFGERIESPSATKLPVLLAVALLKDRNGVIDINLPVSGSLNDPQFSIGGVILRLIGNLLLKALTAPFSLFAGGGTEDLSAVAFEPGTATIAAAGAGAVDKVAKALAERPALKLTVTGAADARSEGEAYQRAAIEQRLLAEKRREALRTGAAASAPAALAAEERSRLLRSLYRRTDLPGKPRNVIGLVKDLPDAEMEALLRRQIPVTDEALRELALQRGLVVRDLLVARGLTSDRLFLAAPKLRPAGEGAWTPSVQLAVSAN